ncbi:MAG: hypothetical protein EOP05_17180, partial [Proteobacteria bacterium]
MPTLTSLNSEVEGIELQSAKTSFYSTTGNIEITGGCDARVSNLRARVLDENMAPLSEFKPLKEYLDSQASNSTDCGGRSLKFNFAKQHLVIDESAMATNASAVRYVQLEGWTEFGSKPQASLRLKFTKDSEAPVVSISSAQTSATINLAQASAAAIGGACETGLDVVLSFGTPAIEKKVPCVNSAYSASLDVSSQPDGTLTLKATQVDEAGNTSALVSFIANKDVVPPTLNLISLSPTGANRATQTNISLNLECEAGLSVAFESP